MKDCRIDAAEHNRSRFAHSSARYAENIQIWQLLRMGGANTSGKLLIDNKVFENANFLRNENLQLSVQNEKLRIEGNDGKPLNSTEAKLHEEVQQFKQKFLVQAEELTELHRRKGEHAQQIIDLTSRLQEQDKLVAVRDSK
ncbi:hypothetical protein YQE_10322, partial [Dendroctonus ponderosae]